jgi:glycerol-3-phosphate cytidylyltransferase
MTNIITYGTFDTFHYGHLEILLRAKSLGRFLIVAVSTDEFNIVKGKQSIFDFATRKKWIESIKCVDLVIPEISWDQKENDIVKYNIDILVMGDDWQGKFDYLKCETVYFPRTATISTSAIKNIL